MLPATYGAAWDVPERKSAAVVPLVLADNILAPGAQISTQLPTFEATFWDSHKRWSSVSVAATVIAKASLQKAAVIIVSTR